MEFYPNRPSWVTGSGITVFYYINTNEIPGELLHKNLIYLHMWKMTCYLHMWKYHRCYDYIINRAFHTKKLLQWNGLVVHWCLYKKDNITWLLGDTKFLFLCWRNISLIRCTHLWNILQPSKRNFISPCDHVISSIYLISNKSFTKRQYNEIFIKIIMVKKTNRYWWTCRHYWKILLSLIAKNLQKQQRN